MRTITRLYVAVAIWNLISVCYSRHLVKRQIFGSNRQFGRDDYQLPRYSPYPGRSASGVAPNFPFTTAVNGGVQVDPASRTTLDGFLNVPIPTWGLFDLTGGLEDGQTPIDVGFGVIANPTNNLGLSPRALYELGNDPKLSATQGGPSQSVGILPGGMSPLNCKLPMCNPFMQTTGVGVDVDLPDDIFQGGLDFPIPLAENGIGTRFPLSGGIRNGTSPINVNYAHHAGPIDPFKKLWDPKKETRTQTQVIREYGPTDFRGQGLVMSQAATQNNPASLINNGARSSGIVRSVFRRRKFSTR